jgi:ribosomal protein S18 acetylase RimI-like enzyme
VAVKIRQLEASDLAKEVADFAELLHACVVDGASVGFIVPFSLAEAAAFWRDKVLPGMNGTVLLAAFDHDRLVGTVQLGHDTMPNQPHRADVRKLLVHPDMRRRGIAKALMVELEAEAKRLKRSLLTLDTRTGDKAEPLYTALGYETVGVIPDFCRDTLSDRLDGTTIMFKRI